jgi:hypothetical protein
MDSKTVELIVAGVVLALLAVFWLVLELKGLGGYTSSEGLNDGDRWD